MNTIENKPQQVMRLGWFRFSLRRLFVVVTLIAIGFALFEPLKLHFTALHFFNIRNTVIATRPHPEELLYTIGSRILHDAPELAMEASFLVMILCRSGFSRALPVWIMVCDAMG